MISILERKPKLESYLQEAHDRNAVLIKIYGKIPSYSLWTDYSIEEQTISTRMEWWSNYEDNDDEFVKNKVSYWLQCLEDNILS